MQSAIPLVKSLGHPALFSSCHSVISGKPGRASGHIFPLLDCNKHSLIELSRMRE